MVVAVVHANMLRQEPSRIWAKFDGIPRRNGCCLFFVFCFFVCRASEQRSTLFRSHSALRAFFVLNQMPVCVVCERVAWQVKNGAINGQCEEKNNNNTNRKIVDFVLMDGERLSRVRCFVCAVHASHKCVYPERCLDS